MSTDKEKLAMSKTRVSKAVEAILSADPNFTGQFLLECHCKDGTVRDVYDIRSRRKI